LHAEGTKTGASAPVFIISSMKKRNRKIIISFVSLLFSAVLLSYITTPFEKDFYVNPSSDSKKQIALTFDDGPGKYTQELLDGLRERDVKTSFFLMGSKVEKHPELIKQMYDDGHLIGCHTWSHISFFKSSMDEIHAELSSTNELLESITGEKVQFFRPPYGYYFGTQLNKIDMIAVLWSDTPRDWVNIDIDYICNYIVENAKDGQIILLHDTKDATVPAVLKAIDILLDEGYEFVRADELLCRNGDYLAAGLAYRYCPYNGRAWYI